MASQGNIQSCYRRKGGLGLGSASSPYEGHPRHTVVFAGPKGATTAIPLLLQLKSSQRRQ